MAKRTPMTPEVRQRILDVYEETTSVRETGRRLNLHENSVRLVLKASKGLCSDCPTPIMLGKRYCEACTKRRNDWDKARRDARRSEGLCVECDEVVQRPSSTYCAKHRLDHQGRSRKSYRTVNQQRLVTGSGVPETQQREKQLRYTYGMAGVEAWQRDNGCCTICGVAHEDKAVHVHHLDEDPTHNAKDNLVCLCLKCHRLVHHMLEHPALTRFLGWFLDHYPTHDFSAHFRRKHMKMPSPPETVLPLFIPSLEKTD